jgi:hypothetical protein
MAEVSLMIYPAPGATNNKENYPIPTMVETTISFMTSAQSDPLKAQAAAPHAVKKFI